MSLTNEQLKELLDLAKTAAIKAGKIIASRQGEDIVTISKEGGENIASQVVTDIDLEVEKAIIKILKPSFEKYQLGLLAEENTENRCRFSYDYFWCVDPLDGTLCFSNNEDGYSTSIALVSKEGESVLGVVNDPRNQTIYYASKGEGAFKNGEPFEIKKKSHNLTLLFDQSYLKYEAYDEQIEKLKIDLQEYGLGELIIHPLGGAVMNGISTIELAPAFYYKFPKKADGGGSLWDFSASSIIVAEAGGM